MKEEDRAVCESILAVGRRMYAKNMVVSNDGNISCRVANGIWTTPTGVCKGDMTLDMLVKVDENGQILWGQSKPSSELNASARVSRKSYGTGRGACASAHGDVLCHCRD